MGDFIFKILCYRKMTEAEQRALMEKILVDYYKWLDNQGR